VRDIDDVVHDDHCGVDVEQNELDCQSMILFASTLSVIHFHRFVVDVDVPIGVVLGTENLQYRT
jgi:hypothetical protein